MADMILSSAQGAVGSLLSRLTSALSEEAQLLGSVRSEVQFIKDEMESMNGFLLHMMEVNNHAEEEDHQVRAWMKQVAEVAYASQNCVDIYVQSLGTRAGEQGPLGFLHRLPRLLWMLPARHRVAMQIRQLKIRAQEVGERRLRYGVAIAAPAHSRFYAKPSRHAVEDEDTKEQEDARRRALAEAEPVPFESSSLIKWMTTKLPCLDERREKTHNSTRDPLSGHLVDGTEEKLNSRRVPIQRGWVRENSCERNQRLKDQEDSKWSIHSRSCKRLADQESDDDEYFDMDDEEDEEEEEFYDVEGGGGGEGEKATPRVIALEGDPDSGAAQFAKKAYEDPWVARSCSLDYKAWIQLGSEYPPGPSRLLLDILAKLDPPVGQLDSRVEWNHEQLMEKLKLHLKGKKFLIVLEDVRDPSLWDGIRLAFAVGNCSPGSAFLVTTISSEVSDSFSPYKVCEMSMLDSERRHYLAKFYLKQAIGLLNSNPGTKHRKKVLISILRDMALQTQNCRLFLAALYANPNRTLDSFLSLQKKLKNYSSSKNKKLVLSFAYDGLSSNCKSCLLYLNNFPEHTTFRRARFVRRCAAEGMVTKRGGMNALEEADRCLNILVSHKFVTPIDTDVTGKVKRFKMCSSAHDLVTEIASNENFFRTSLPSDLGCRLPSRNAVQQQHIAQLLHATNSKASWNICNRFGQSKRTEIDDFNATTVFLESLPSSTHLGLLEVLDLEDCKDLKNKHLKNICNCLFQLKYLSLRNTEISILPKQINKLHYLETLDIRQTKVRRFAKNSGMLPNLKHLLAGYHTGYRNKGSSHSEEPFLTVQMPRCVGFMTELQVLSHVAVSGRGDVLNDISSLLQLRKLGLVLSECQKPIFRHLYHVLGNLSKSLRTLSIQIIPNNDNADVATGNEATLLMPPKYLTKLEISGLANGLPQWVKVLRELKKLALHKTFLTADDIEILGDLTSLSYLLLQQESCSERTLTFRKDKFQSLKFLVIECSDITSINFGDEATPMLRKIAWSSDGPQSLSISGIEHLQNLKELELSGNFNIQMVERAIAANKANPTLKTSKDNN